MGPFLREALNGTLALVPGTGKMADGHDCHTWLRRTLDLPIGAAGDLEAFRTYVIPVDTTREPSSSVRLELLP